MSRADILSPVTSDPSLAAYLEGKPVLQMSLAEYLANGADVEAVRSLASAMLTHDQLQARYGDAATEAAFNAVCDRIDAINASLPCRLLPNAGRALQ